MSEISVGYEVTATRKRPQKFSTVLGQSYVVTTLLNSLKTGRIAHAYLFSGSRGVGKTSTARIFARALNCPNESQMGTDEGLDYFGAEDISKGIAIDVIEIDGASNTSVNDVRTIREEILFPPQNFRYKIYIIDEVHMLSNSAFNALLKTIEEPPPYIVFIFATTEIHKVPATIRSRCQQFHFRLISQDEILKSLESACAEANPPITAENEALYWIAREANGSMRDAYTILDQVIAFSDRNLTYEKIKDVLGILGVNEIKELVRKCISENYNAVYEYLHTLLSASTTVDQLLIDLSNFYRTLLFIKQGVQNDASLSFSRSMIENDLLEAYTVTQLEKVIELLLQAYRDIRYTLNSQLELEVVVSKILRVRQYFDPNDIVAKIEALHESILEGSIAGKEGINIQAIQPETISQPMWKSAISELEKTSPKVAAVMAGIDDWEYNNSTLIIYNSSHMIIDQLKQNASLIVDCMKTLYNIDIKIQVELRSEKTEISEDEQEIEKVRKIFNGKVIQ